MGLQDRDYYRDHLRKLKSGDDGHSVPPTYDPLEFRGRRRRAKPMPAWLMALLFAWIMAAVFFAVDLWKRFGH